MSSKTMNIIQKILVHLSSKRFIKPIIRQKVLNKCIGTISHTAEISPSCYFYGNQIVMGGYIC